MVSKNVISLLVTSLLIHFLLKNKNDLNPLKELWVLFFGPLLTVLGVPKKIGWGGEWSVTPPQADLGGGGEGPSRPPPSDPKKLIDLAPPPKKN